MLFHVLTQVVGAPFETDAEKLEPIHRGDAAKCPQCGNFVGMLPWLPPYRVALKAFGKTLGDVAFATGDDLVVSQRFRDAWIAAGLKGVTEFSPFERIRIRPARLGRGHSPVYYHVAPQLWNTRVDPTRSLIEYDNRYLCEKCGSPNVESVRGFAIDESSWSGEDIFYAWGMPGSIVVTDRVRKLRDDYGLTNVNLTPVEEYFVDFYRRWTPFALSDDA